MPRFSPQTIAPCATNSVGLSRVSSGRIDASACVSSLVPWRFARKYEPDARSPSGRAVDFRASAVQDGDAPDDGKSQADPAPVAGPRLIDAEEAVEDVRQVLRRDAVAGVGHLDDDRG